MYKSFLLAAMLISPLCASAQYGAIDNVVANLDPVLSAAFMKAQAGMPAFSVPAPVSISPDRASDTPAGDYLPLKKRAVYDYEYTSSEFTGPKAIRIEYLDYSEKDATVRVNMVIFSNGKAKPKVVNFIMTATQAGIRSSDSPLAGARLEIPFPLVYNQTWNEGSDRNRVAALNAKVAVPAGTYNGCLKITTKLGGGDSGAAERYYAPGVGLVYEQIISEDRQELGKRWLPIA